MSDGSPKPHGAVAVGVLRRADGTVLLNQRPAGKQWAGWWELPGGKFEPGESAQQALARELHEELGITVTQATPWVQYVHEYEQFYAHLHFYRVTAWEGTPTGLEQQTLAWVKPQHPDVSPLLPAVGSPLRWMQLPIQYLITSIDDTSHLPAFLQRLERTLCSGESWLVQFREPAWQARSAPGYTDLYHAFTQVLACCQRHKVPCLINSTHPQDWWSEASGVHLRATDARTTSTRPHDGLVGVSAHDASELAQARRLQANFAVLGHVLDTPSHAHAPAMGWAAFRQHLHEAGLPVYAVGGQSLETLQTAQAHGAHGVAGMRQLLFTHTEGRS